MAGEEQQKQEAQKQETAKPEVIQGQAPAQPPKAPELPKLDVLGSLKSKADVLGIGYGPDIDEATLLKKIQDKLSGVADAAEAKDSVMTESELRQKIYNENMFLVRCRITNMNPQKADLAGEVFVVSNRYLGEVKRYIPYGEQLDGWHVEKILLDMLREKKFQQIRIKKGQNGQQLPETKWVPEFNIEELEPLTREELKVLANKQAAAAGMSVE